MEGFWIQLLAILTLLTQTCSASGTTELINTTELIGAVGGSVTFRSNSTDTNPAFWSFGSDPIVTVPFEDPPRPLFSKEEFKTRFAVSERGRALSISQLRMEDAGTYSVTINGKKSTFTLQVYKELPEPTVTCKYLNCSNERCLVSLRCSVPDTGFGNVSYTWRRGLWLWDEESLVVALMDKLPPDVREPLMCTARNAVSSRNVTVTNSGGLCSENSTHPPDPDALSSSEVRTAIIVGLIGVAVLLLFFLLLYCKFKGWRKFHPSRSNPTNTATTGEFTTVYAEVGHSQQHIPNGIKPKPAGGESSNTIYSVVKGPEQVESATMTGLKLV